MKTGCTETRRIAALMLGDVTEEERHELEAHLAGCPECREEQQGWAQTIQQLDSARDESVPRHFFVYPEERNSSPWRLFRLLPAGWQAATVGAMALLLALGMASALRVQIGRNGEAWAVGFGPSNADLAAVKRQALEAVAIGKREAMREATDGLRGELRDALLDARRQLSTELAQAQRSQLYNAMARAMARIDARTAGRINAAEGEVRADTQAMVAALYEVVARQRASDLEAISLRFDRNELNSAIKTQKTYELMDVVLQVTDMSLDNIDKKEIRQ